VLFIAGNSRSGSSLLASLLARATPALNLGELYYLWDRGLIEGWRCSCGRSVHDCALWGPVIDDTDPPIDPFSMVAARHRHLRSRQLHRLASRSRGEMPPADLLALAGATERTIRSAASMENADVVIDASKRASMAVMLAEFTSLDVRVVHLVRDPRATVVSWSRDKPNPADGGVMRRRSALLATKDWIVFNGAVDRYVVPRVPTVRVRYEDLVSDPDPVLAAVRANLSLPVGSPGRASIAEHSISGNPDRFGFGDVRPASSDREDLPFVPRVVVPSMCAPLMRRYGYR
jgi:hypothetical protein